MRRFVPCLTALAASALLACGRDPVTPPEVSLVVTTDRTEYVRTTYDNGDPVPDGPRVWVRNAGRTTLVVPRCRPDGGTETLASGVLVEAEQPDGTWEGRLLYGNPCDWGTEPRADLTIRPGEQAYVVGIIHPSTQSGRFRVRIPFGRADADPAPSLSAVSAPYVVR